MLMFSFFASFFFFVSFLLWVFGASFCHLFIAHPQYWHCSSAFFMHFSSSCLSCVSVMMLFAWSNSVLATDNLCAMRYSDVHSKYWLAWVGFLYSLILMFLHEFYVTGVVYGVQMFCKFLCVVDLDLFQYVICISLAKAQSTVCGCSGQGSGLGLPWKKRSWCLIAGLPWWTLPFVCKVSISISIYF